MRSLPSAFVGLGYHLATTKSSDFFIEVLRNTLPRLEVFSEEWSWVKLPRRVRWDTVVFWQHPPTRLLLDSISARNVILVPMYDTCSLERAYWDAYRDCGIVCFSSTLADLLEGWGHRVLRVRYAPEPGPAVDWSTNRERAFFWPRKADLPWSTIRSLLHGQTWERIHLHVTEPDQALTQGLEEDRARWSLHETHWFRKRAEYAQALSESRAFFAPRRTEGIGMSFLEAMALGMAVVAPNGATMNEYLRSGENGYLYDPDHPVAPDWSQAEAWGSQARADMLRWRTEWVKSLEALKVFVRSEGVERPPGRMTEESWAQRLPIWKRYRWFRLANPLRWLKARLFR